MTKKQVFTISLVCIILAVLSALLFRETANENTLSPLTCTFLKVGKADAMVLETKGLTMVIDTGEEDDGQELVDFLRNKHISLIDILIITHYDKDHVGGADTLISEIPAVRVLIPDYENSSTEYADFMVALKNASIEPEWVSSAQEFPFGDALVNIYPPASYEIPDGVLEYDNNFSLVASITHGSNRLLFTGDIEKNRIRELLSNGQLQECNFLKVPHHGIYNTALEDFLKKLNPQYAVICSSNKHPAEEATMELLKKQGVYVLETRNGNITLTSNGQHLELQQKCGY